MKPSKPDHDAGKATVRNQNIRTRAQKKDTRAPDCRTPLQIHSRSARVFGYGKDSGRTADLVIGVARERFVEFDLAGEFLEADLKSTFEVPELIRISKAGQQAS